MDQSMHPEMPVSNSSSRPVSRAHSSLSEKPVFSKTILSPPPPVNPDPAYISSSAASQWVSAELEDDDLVISEVALSLLNSFLDQMLHSFLASARSTRLPQLRQAIPEVLKPRLGKEAMASADEELREYLGDGEDEELSDFYDGHEPARDFDLEVAWKLARLRCMVYTRLGDLEEEDALEIIEREHLDERGGQHRRFSSSSSNITPAGAIFLTSIIEYLGEQALYHAGLLAQTRASNIHSQSLQGSTDTAVSPSQPSTQTIIEEIDVRRLGREGPLARIWRNWRRPARSPQDSISWPRSPSDYGDFPSPSESPKQSAGSMVGLVPLPTIAQTIHSSDPTQIPLPISENDVNEIEVPGLAREIDDDGIAGSAEIQDVEKAKRPNSMIFLPHNADQPLTPTSVHMPSTIAYSSPQRPAPNRQRSQSLPTPPQSPLTTMRESPKEKPSVVSFPATHKIHEESGTTEAIRDGMPTRDAVAQDEQHSTRHGLVMAAIPAHVDTQGSRSMVAGAHFQSEAAESAAAARETIADKMLHKSVAADQVSSSAATEASIHDVTDFESMHIPERNEISKTASTEAHGEDNDPEDLALSSADEEPKTTQRSSKHDSVPPIKVGSSSYTYSTQPGDTYMPMPVYSDFEGAPSRDQAVTVASLQPESGATRGIPPMTRRDPQISPEEQNHIPQDSSNQPEVGTLIEAQTATSSGSFRPSTLTRNAESELSQISSHSTSSSKLLGYTRDDQGRPVPSTASEDIDMQQAAPTSQSRATSGPWHRPSTSTGVSTDTGPGIAGSQQPSAQPPSRLPMSPDDGREAGARTSFESEAKKKSLELLIQGDETLHYTLTPTSARAREFPDPVRRAVGQGHDSGDYGTIAASSNQQSIQHRGQHSIGSMVSANGLRSHPVKEQFTSQIAAAAPALPITSSRVTTSRPGTSSSKVRHGEPREAKVEPSTSRDLADYLRSTGPESDNQLPRALVSRPTTSATQAPPTPRTAIHSLPNAEQSRTATKANSHPPSHSSDGSINSGRASTSAPSRASGASRHVPRDAQVSKNSTTSALADFIREGPPRAAGDHRIPRTVAPFRTTMDSDDLNGLVSATDKDPPGRSSAASTQDSSTISQSVQSSTNSHTGLLDRSKMKSGPSTNGGRTGISTFSPSSQSTGRDAVPKRKQRRVRDPYAIDDSDEDIEEVVTLKPKRDEESLIDFLRNTAPQPSMTAQPFVASNSSAAPKQSLQKQNSSSAIKDRIRNTTIPGLNRKNSVNTTDPPAYSRGTAPRAESPHLSQAGSKLDSYKPTKPTHAAHVDRVRSSRANGAVASSAEHLPNTELSRTARTANTTKDESGFLAFFSRRKSIKQG